MRKRPNRSLTTFVEMRREGKQNTQVWLAWSDGEEVVSQWGILDGQMQETVDIPGAKGKEGTQAWVDPRQAAFDQLVRDIRTKAQKGYEIVSVLRGNLKAILEGELADVTRADNIFFDGPLPNNIAFSKPQNSIEPKKLMKLAARPTEGHGGPPLVWSVKKNGMCYIVSKDKHDKVWIQSRGKLIVENDKFPHLVEEFEAFLPPMSILLCELYVKEGKSKDDFRGMQQISNSLVPRALEMQKKLGLVHAYVFRVPFWKGANMEENSACTVWLEFLQNLIDGWENEKGPPQLGFADTEFIHGLIITDDSYEDALKEMVEEGYEGYVVYDCWGSLGEKHLSFLGQPDRPNVCWKVKQALEDDFIAVWDPDGDLAHCTSKCHVDLTPVRTGKTDVCPGCGKKLTTDGTWGTGKNKKRVGSMSLYQYDKNGGLIYICEFASGLTDEDKQEIADMGSCEMIAQIGYQDRSFISQGADSNALTHPKLLSWRDDKDPKECTNQEL